MTFKTDTSNPIDQGLCASLFTPENGHGCTPAEKAWVVQIPEGDLNREIAYLQAMEVRLLALLANLEDIPQYIRDGMEDPARVEYLRALTASALKISRLTRALISRSQASGDPGLEPGLLDGSWPADTGY